MMWAGESKYYLRIRLLIWQVGPDWSACGVATSLICCCRNTFTTDTAKSTPDLTLLQLNITKTVICIQGATRVHWQKDSAHIGEYNASHYWIFYQNKMPIWKILRTDKNNNFKFTIKFLMTLDRSYIGYLDFLGIDLFKSVLMYSNGAICLIKLLFKMGLFTVCPPPPCFGCTA
jgi:hypothetical protein